MPSKKSDKVIEKLRAKKDFLNSVNNLMKKAKTPEDLDKIRAMVDCLLSENMGDEEVKTAKTMEQKSTIKEKLELLQTLVAANHLLETTPEAIDLKKLNDMCEKVTGDRPFCESDEEILKKNTKKSIWRALDTEGKKKKGMHIVLGMSDFKDGMDELPDISIENTDSGKKYKYGKPVKKSVFYKGVCFVGAITFGILGVGFIFGSVKIDNTLIAVMIMCGFVDFILNIIMPRYE